MPIIRQKKPVDCVSIPVAFVLNPSLSRAAKLVYISAAARVQHGEPEPSIQTIIDETQLTEAHVKDGIRQLALIDDAEWQRLGL